MIIIDYEKFLNQLLSAFLLTDPSLQGEKEKRKKKKTFKREYRDDLNPNPGA